MTSTGRLIAVGMAVLSAAFAAVVWWAGDELSQPARTETGPPPADLGAREISFRSASGATLNGWFAPGTAGRGAVLLLHPIRTDKRAMLPRARFLHRLGFSLLLLDLQAHGASSGERITFGERESGDVLAAVTQLKALAPGERIGALGVSLGAAAVVLSDASTAFDAVVLESLYPTIEQAVANRLRLRFGTPGTALAPLLLLQLRLRLGIAPSQLRPIDRIGKLRAPLLLVHGTEDRHTTLAEAERLFSAARDEKSLYAVAGAGHEDLHAFAGREYEQRISRFLASHLSRSD